MDKDADYNKQKAIFEDIDQPQSQTNSGSSSNIQSEEFKEYPQRIWTLIGFFFLSTIFTMNTMTFNPISAHISDIYGIQPVIVNMNGLIINFLALPLSFPVGMLIERIGLQKSLRIAAVLGLVASWVRIFVNWNYYSTLMGQTIIGLGYPIIQNCITKVSLVWFRAEKREIVTRAIMLMMFLTTLLGNIMSGQWFSSYNQDTDKLQDYKNGKDRLSSLLFVQALIVTAFVIPGVVLFGEKPPTAPSFTSVQKRQPLKTSLQALFKNKDYLLVLSCFALFNGTFHSIGVTVSFELDRFGLGSGSVSFIGIAMMLCGVGGNFLGQYLFKRTPRFRAFLYFGVGGMISGFAISMAVYPTGSIFLVIIPYALIGASSIQSFPIFLELSSECGYPVAEAFSTGFLQGCAQMTGFALGSIFSLILDMDGELPVYIVQISSIGVLLICGIMLKFMKVQLRRKKIDAKHQTDLVIINEDEVASSEDYQQHGSTSSDVSENN